MNNTETEIDVSVVIVSFNTRDILRRCLHALQAASGDLCIETIVVDNASRDGSADMVAAEFPRARLIRNQENRMFAPATNQGLVIARGRNLLLLNSDAFVRANTLTALAAFLDNQAKAAAVGPKVLNMDGSLQSKGFVAPRIGLGLLRVSGLNKWMPGGMKRRLFPRYYWDENKRVEPDVLSGCCVMLRSSVVQHIGALDEAFHHGGEDAEWCFRARLGGYRTWYLPHAEVEHIGGASKALVENPIVIRDTVRAWETSFGVSYGVIAETLSAIYLAQRLLAAWLTGRDAAGRARTRAELRLARSKIAALCVRLRSLGARAWVR